MWGGRNPTDLAVREFNRVESCEWILFFKLGREFGDRAARIEETRAARSNDLELLVLDGRVLTLILPAERF